MSGSTDGTKDLAKRIGPGEIAVIDHEDLDRVAAETLIEAGVGAIVNAAASISGRYPNVGPLLVAAAGIPLLDDVGSEVLERVADGQPSSPSTATSVRCEGETIASGSRQSIGSLEETWPRPAGPWAASSSASPTNTLEYIQKEGHLLVDEPDIPDVPVDFKGRHALIVVRGHRLQERPRRRCATAATSPRCAPCSSGSTAGPTR